MLLFSTLNFTKLPNENDQYTGEGKVARCDKQKWGYTKNVIYCCLGHYENFNALGPLGHFKNPHGALKTSA